TPRSRQDLRWFCSHQRQFAGHARRRLVAMLSSRHITGPGTKSCSPDAEILARKKWVADRMCQSRGLNETVGEMCGAGRLQLCSRQGTSPSPFPAPKAKSGWPAKTLSEMADAP